MLRSNGCGWHWICYNVLQEMGGWAKWVNLGVTSVLNSPLGREGSHCCCCCHSYYCCCKLSVTNRNEILACAVNIKQESLLKSPFYYSALSFLYCCFIIVRRLKPPNVLEITGEVEPLRPSSSTPLDNTSVIFHAYRWLTARVQVHIKE